MLDFLYKARDNLIIYGIVLIGLSLLWIIANLLIEENEHWISDQNRACRQVSVIMWVLAAIALGMFGWRLYNT